MLILLKSAGVKFDIKNSSGLTPLDIILRAKAENLFRGFKTLKLLKNNNKEIEFTSCRLENYENIQDKTPEINVDKDYESYRAKVIVGDTDDDSNQKPELDKVLGLPSATAYVISENEKYLDVLMTKIDLKFARSGLYNFYKMQVVHNTSAGLYVLLTRWGRIGDQGQHQMTPFSAEKDAIAEFKSIYKSKSGNLWESEKFENKPGKYRLVDPENRKSTNQNQIDIKISLKSDKKSLLSKPLQSLFRDCVSIFSA